MNLTVSTATEVDAPAIVSLRNSVAEHLTRQFGRGHWSSMVSEKAVLHGIQTSRVLVARNGSAIIATLRLLTKKPWAIDRAYFMGGGRPLYLVDMAVEPGLQRQGVGRFLLEEAKAVGRAWPREAIHLDAYDGPAGAGSFYVKCGFREVGRASYRGVPLIYFEVLL
jgi:GNAT superfamily N-acetyltransferase